MICFYVAFDCFSNFFVKETKSSLLHPNISLSRKIYWCIILRGFTQKNTPCKKGQYVELFWPAFSRIFLHSDWLLLQSISPYSILMQENLRKMQTRITPNTEFFMPWHSWRLILFLIHTWFTSSTLPCILKENQKPAHLIFHFFCFHIYVEVS